MDNEGRMHLISSVVYSESKYYLSENVEDNRYEINKDNPENYFLVEVISSDKLNSKGGIKLIKKIDNFNILQITFEGLVNIFSDYDKNIGTTANFLGGGFLFFE
jgi:hypothetical protein